jgi:DNA-binding transcriptional LysR family regulator
VLFENDSSLISFGKKLINPSSTLEKRLEASHIQISLSQEFKMDFEKLKSFYIVAKTGSFTQASEIVNLSQPAISRQVGCLEDRLKTKLFVRNGRGIALTHAGKTLYLEAEDILTRISKLKSLVHESSQQLQGPLIVATTSDLASKYLAPFLGEFAEAYPEIRLTLVMLDQFGDMKYENFHAMVCSSHILQEPLKKEMLTDYSLKLYASHSYLKRFGEPEVPQDLDHHRLICERMHFNNSFSPTRWLLTFGCAEGESRHPFMEINTMEAQLKLAEAGAGIVSLPENYPSQNHVSLQEVLPQTQGPKIQVCYAYEHYSKSPRLVSVFGSYLKGKFNKI